MRILVAPDKFRGSATAAEVVAAVAERLEPLGHEVIGVPLADGGEGTLDALGGANQTSTVTGPLGEPVEARWRYASRTAVIEMSEASGLQLAGGAEGNDPIGATTAGTGELIDLAVDRGAKKVVVGLGGSATTDGGWDAVEALVPTARLKGVELLVACDVETLFTDAARVFGPQKGATAAQITFLTNRLERLVDMYLERFGVDVSELPRAGAAGGLAGGLAAVGADLVGGFGVVAEEVGLAEAIAAADLVVTGEGKLDDQSFVGKVVGGVAELADEVGVPVLAVAGMIELDARPESGPAMISLTEQFGMERSMADAASLVADVVADHIAALAADA